MEKAEAVTRALIESPATLELCAAQSKGEYSPDQTEEAIRRLSCSSLERIATALESIATLLHSQDMRATDTPVASA